MRHNIIAHCSRHTVKTTEFKKQCEGLGKISPSNFEGFITTLYTHATASHTKHSSTTQWNRLVLCVWKLCSSVIWRM